MKSFTIGEKRETKHDGSMGPGYYNAERGDSQTKSKVTTTVNMGSSPPRNNTFARASGYDVAPG